MELKPILLLKTIIYNQKYVVYNCNPGYCSTTCIILHLLFQLNYILEEYILKQPNSSQTLLFDIQNSRF